MKRWLWILSTILISTLVYSTIRYGLRPKPIPILNATEFEDLQQIGAVIYKRLRQNIRPERVIVLGTDPALIGSDNIWLGFLKTATADRVKVDVFFEREGLPPFPANESWATVTYDPAKVGSGEFKRQVEERLKAGHLVVVHGLTSEVSHLMKGSISRILDEAAKHPVLALSTIGLALQPEDIQNLQEQCLKPSLQDDSSVRLDCAELRVSRVLLKKHPAPGKIWAVMERHGLQEYLVFVHD